MSVAAYVRVSSASQNEGMQKQQIAQVARARGDGEPSWYAETFSSGTLSRPELERLRRDVRTGGVRKVYVWRLDRLTRTGIRDTLDLVEELGRFGCQLVTVSDGFDLQGPAAEIVLAVLAWAAKMERHAINERIAAARDRMRTEGRPWGRPKRMPVFDQKRARALADEGKSVREIARALKVPRTTVWRALSQKDAQNRPLKKAGDRHH